MAKIKVFILVFTFLFLALLLPGRVLAARFLFLPSSASITSGGNFTVQLMMDTAGVQVNAAEGTISFPQRYLQVDNISTNGSVFKFWSQDPTFSNTSGNINFGGGLPSPGVSSPSAKILTINFKVTGIGTATLHLETGAILANDGVGTNILTQSGDGIYQISTETGKLQQPTQEQNAAPGAPFITSRTHPDEGTWYNVNTFEASWSIPGGVDGVSYVLVNSANYSAAPASKGLVNSTSYDLTKFTDGVWYFYVQFHTADGWGPVSKRKVKIDRTPPGAFSVLRTDNGDPTSPRPTFSWNAKDDTSGIAKYSLKIGEGDPFDAQTILLQSGDYSLPLQSPGTRNIAVQATDYAGNSIETSVPFTVSPIPGPTILNYPKTYSSRDKRFIVDGEALSGQKVILTLSNGNKAITFGTSLVGQGDFQSKTNWTTEYDENIPSGDWKLTAISQDSRGAQSNPTDPVYIRVNGIFSRFGPFIVEYGAVIAFSMLILGLLAALGYFIYHSLLMWRIRLKHDLRRLQAELRDDLRELDKELAPLMKGVRKGNGSALKRTKARVRGRVAKIEKDLESEIDRLGVS